MIKWITINGVAQTVPNIPTVNGVTPRGMSSWGVSHDAPTEQLLQLDSIALVQGRKILLNNNTFIYTNEIEKVTSAIKQNMREAELQSTQQQVAPKSAVTLNTDVAPVASDNTVMKDTTISAVKPDVRRAKPSFGGAINVPED